MIDLRAINNGIMAIFEAKKRDAPKIFLSHKTYRP